MNPSGFISRCIRLCVFFVGFAVVAIGAFGAATDERAANLREKISTLEGVVSATKNAAEKSRLDESLQRLRRELALLDERQAIEARERQLRARHSHGTQDLLREKLRGIVIATEDLETRMRQIILRRQQAAMERDALSTQIATASAKGNSGTVAQVQLQERLFNTVEELRALALEQEAGEAELELARESERLRKRLKEIDAAGQNPSLKALFECYTLLSEGRKMSGRLAAEFNNLQQNLTVSESALELARQKLTRFAEELALLEKQTGFFTRDPLIERFLAEERSQKDALNERMPFLLRQVDATKRTMAYLEARQELTALELTFQQEQFDRLKSAYMQRLRWPAVALTGMLIVHLLAGYLLLPLIYKNESLVLARRLVCYVLVVAATVVVAGFLFDDLKMIAAAGGLVSAAIVISLQDVCASIFAWFVIMLGGKFGIGDRLEVEGSQGDVIDIDLLRTTLLEVNGWLGALGTDEPTGRVITMPNNFIFKSKVFNFTHGHPYIWGKLDLTVNAATPVAQALVLFERVLAEEGAEQFAAAQAASATMRRRYGVDDAIYKPKINLLIVDTGVLISLFYVAHYRHNSATRNKISRRLVAELEKHPHIQLSCPTLQLLHDNLEPGAPSAVFGSNRGVVPVVVPERN